MSPIVNKPLQPSQVRTGGAICDAGSLPRRADVTQSQTAHRARGLARQATEDRVRAERTLETLRIKERQACTAALLAEAADMQVHP